MPPPKTAPCCKDKKPAVKEPPPIRPSKMMIIRKTNVAKLVRQHKYLRQSDALRHVFPYTLVWIAKENKFSVFLSAKNKYIYIYIWGCGLCKSLIFLYNFLKSTPLTDSPRKLQVDWGNQLIWTNHPYTAVSFYRLFHHIFVVYSFVFRNGTAHLIWPILSRESFDGVVSDTSHFKFEMCAFNTWFSQFKVKLLATFNL